MRHAHAATKSVPKMTMNKIAMATYAPKRLPTPSIYSFPAGVLKFGLKALHKGTGVIVQKKKFKAGPLNGTLARLRHVAARVPRKSTSLLPSKSPEILAHLETVFMPCNAS